MHATSLAAPRLIVLSGLAASGKSTIADGIGQAFGIPVLSVDPIESAILEAGITRSFETGLAAYLVAQAIADRHLAAGLGVVIDAANYGNEGRELWRGLAIRHGVPMAVIEVKVADPDRHLGRLAARNRGLALPEPTPSDIATQRREWIEWPEPHLVLDGLASAAENIRQALAYLGVIRVV